MDHDWIVPLPQKNRKLLGYRVSGSRLDIRTRGSLRVPPVYTVYAKLKGGPKPQVQIP